MENTKWHKQRNLGLECFELNIRETLLIYILIVLISQDYEICSKKMWEISDKDLKVEERTEALSKDTAD